MDEHQLEERLRAYAVATDWLREALEALSPSPASYPRDTSSKPSLPRAMRRRLTSSRSLWSSVSSQNCFYC